MSTGDVHRGPRRPWVETLVVALTTLMAILILQRIWDARWQWMASVVVVMVFICAVPALVIYLRRERPERVVAIPRREMVRPTHPQPPVGGGAGSQGFGPPARPDSPPPDGPTRRIAEFNPHRPADPAPLEPLVDSQYRDDVPRTEIIGPPIGDPVPPPRYPNGGHRP